MPDAATWSIIGLTALLVVIGYLTYRSQRKKTRLEYVVTTNASLLPGTVAEYVEVSHNGVVIADPSLSIVRVVNTGDRPIPAADFESDLVVTFVGVDEIASAICTATRPPGLQPEIEIADDAVRIKPMLINPADMFQLQVLSSGEAQDIQITGRVADLSVVPRKGLPYPPGSGPEGEMLGVDRFIWFVYAPGVLVGFGIALALSNDLSTSNRILFPLAIALTLVGYLLRTRYLVRRRALWRP